MSADKDLCRLLFDTAGNAILVLQNHKIVDCNASAANMFNSSAETLHGKLVYDLWPATQPNGRESKLAWQEHVDAALAGQQQNFEWLYRRSSQAAFYAQVMLSSIEFNGDHYVQAALLDVTQYKQPQAEPQQQELLRQVLDLNPDFIFVKDREGRFTLANQAFAKAYGTTVKELIGKTDADFNPNTELVARYNRDDLKVIETGQELLIPEEEITNIKGERLWRKTIKRPILDKNGQVTQVLGIATDITDRKRAELALREREQILQLVMDYIPQFIFWKDKELVYLGCNKNFAKVAGLDTPQEIIGKTDYDLAWKEEEADFYRKMDRQVMEAGEPEMHIIEPQLQADGKQAWLDTNKIPLRNSEGDVIGILGTYEDITERKQLEQKIQESLERRGRQVQLSTLIAQEIAVATNLDELYRRVVTQVKEQFGFYHTQLLRYDAGDEVLELAAGYGEVGRQMVNQGYRVPLGVGPIGRAAALGTPNLYSNVENIPDWQPHPLLPDTRGEIAVPIRLGQQDANAQAMALKGFMQNEFDGFIVCVIDPDVVTPVTREAVKQGVRVLAQSHDLGKENQTAYVGAQEYQTGYMLGLQAGEWARTHLSGDEPLKVGIFNHRTLPPVARREQGIIDGIRAGFQRNFEILANEMAPNPVMSQPVAERWLKTYPDMNMMVGINDGSALGAYQAVIAAGKNDSDSFFIGGVDGVDEALAAIAEGGAFQATVDKSPAKEAYAAFRTLVYAIAGQPYQQNCVVNTTPVNRDNLDDFLVNRLAQKVQQDEVLAGLDLSGIKIGLSVMNLNNPFFAAFANIIAEEAERFGIELVINDPKPVLGVLSVQSDIADALDAEDQLALEGLAGQVAVAIENTRLLEEAKIFHQFADASGQGLSIASLDGKTIYANPALARILEEDNPQNIESLIAYYPQEQQEFVKTKIWPVVMEEGQWFGESTLRSASGKIIPVIENFFVIRDETGTPQYLADIITDITEQKQSESELEARLLELSALQRLITREGWQAFQPVQESNVRGYLFDQASLQPVTANDAGNGDKQQPPLPAPEAGNGQAVTKPVAVHGEVIGKLGIYNEQDQPLNPEDQEFLDLVAEQVAEAMERARLLEQAQRRAVELEAVAQVSSAASTTLEVDNLLQKVVNLTKESFGLYHAHIYLLNDTENRLDLVAGSGSIGQQMVAQNWSIPLEREHSLVVRAARTQKGVIANDVRTEPDFLPNELLPNTRSELAVPLIAGTRMLGVLDVQSELVGRFTDKDLQIHSTLAAQVAAALRNANLYKQVQEALTETEVLYDISAQINAATDLDEALQAAAAPAIATAAESAQLLSFELDDDGQPEWATIIATWARNGVSTTPVGAKFYLPDFVFSNLWMNDPYTPVLIGDVNKDSRVDAATRVAFAEAGTQAAILLPLSLAGNWVGLIVINWTEPKLFTETDQRLYKSLATQSAVAINNLMLLEETRQRAARLEKLTQTEISLSQSDSEEEIVSIIAGGLSTEHPPNRVILQYIEADQSGQPAILRTVASWQDGALWPSDPALGVPVPLEKMPATRLWFNAPDTALLLADVANDPRLDDNSRQGFKQLGANAAAVLPLHSGGRWQGVLIFGWQDTHTFSQDEQFVLQQLLESVSALMASRRAYLAQQEALAETETLYRASRRINEAKDLQEVATAVAQAGPVSVINRIILEMFEHDTSGQVEAVEVIANWHSGYGEPPTPVGTRFVLTEYPHLKMFITEEPLFFDDIQQDKRLDPQGRSVIQQLNIRATAVLPLWVGNRQIGVMLLEAEEVHHFTEQEIRPYVALARQAAIALENQRLLEETQNALAEVEATQRRYTVQAWDAYRARTTTLSHEWVRKGVAAGQESTQQALAAGQQGQPNGPEADESLPEQEQSTPAVKSSLTVPLNVRGEVVGMLGLQESDEREWTPEEQALIEAIAQQMAQAAENLRLIDETQQRAARERRVNEISEKIQAAQTLEEALQIAIKEVGQSLQAPETSIKLEVE